MDLCGPTKVRGRGLSAAQPSLLKIRMTQENIERKHNKHNRYEQKAVTASEVSADEVDALILWHLVIKIGVQHKCAIHYLYIQLD